MPPPPIPWNARRIALLVASVNQPRDEILVKTYSSSNVCAAPQAAEKIVKMKTVRMIRGFRPNMSLILDKIIRKPIIYSLRNKK